MIKVVVDSGCDLTEEMKKTVTVIPLNLQVDDKLYVDDSSLDIHEYLNDVKQSPNLAKTSAPSPELYMESFKGEESIFVVTLSSKLSGSYNSALLAKQMFIDEIGGKFIHVVDSLSASVAETLIALKIQEFAKNNFTDIEIVEKINLFMSNMKTYFILEKLDNLVKSGRMNASIAKIASFFSIKPICCADGNGEIGFVDKIRGYNKAVVRLVDIILKDNLDFENRILAITHVKCLEKALTLKAEVIKRVNFKEIIITEASGLCTTYANKDGIIISF